VLSDALQRVIPFDAFLFGLYDESADTLTFSGYDLGVRTPTETIPAAGTPSSRVIATRRSLIASRSGDPESAGAVVLGTGRPSESTIRAPILGGSRVLGVLSIQSYTPDMYSDQDVDVVEAVASLTATALLNLELLTERRAAQEALQTAKEELEQRIEERTAELRQRTEELENASRALREREEWFRSLIENAHDLVQVLDAEGTTLYVSPSVERILGYDPDELIGRSALELVDPDQRADARAALGRARTDPGATVVGRLPDPAPRRYLEDPRIIRPGDRRQRVGSWHRRQRSRHHASGGSSRRRSATARRGTAR
jgi:PAS domain-containing protein